MENSTQGRNQKRSWLKRLGWIGVMFFLIKGLFWLALFFFAGNETLKSCS
jgi:hypothetical protein